LGALAQLRCKLRITLQEPVTDHELHLAFVAIAGTAGAYAARRLHKYLDQKYRSTIRRFATAKCDTALEVLWNEATDSGELASAYWALVTHPSVSEGLLDRVYGEVHMLSHLAGAQVRVDMQELQGLKRQSTALTRRLVATESRLKAQIADRQAVFRRFTSCLTQAQVTVGELDQARARLRALEGDSLSRRLQEQLEACRGRLCETQSRAERAEAEAKGWKRMALEAGDRRLRLVERLAELQAERDALEAAMGRLLSPDCAACRDQGRCDSHMDLCGRCVLYVGGEPRSARTSAPWWNGAMVGSYTMTSACTITGSVWARSCPRRMPYSAPWIVSVMMRRTGSRGSASSTGKRWCGFPDRASPPLCGV
jgi:hypothetical protein